MIQWHITRGHRASVLVDAVECSDEKWSVVGLRNQYYTDCTRNIELAVSSFDWHWGDQVTEEMDSQLVRIRQSNHPGSSGCSTRGEERKQSFTPKEYDRSMFSLWKEHRGPYHDVPRSVTSSSRMISSLSSRSVIVRILLLQRLDVSSRGRWTTDILFSDQIWFQTFIHSFSLTIGSIQVMHVRYV